MAGDPQRHTIRFEDLGEPVQKLLKSMKGGYTDDDVALLEYVSVKDMAKIFQEMSSDRRAEAIWEELKTALQTRREKAESKRRAMEDKKKELESEAQNAVEEEAQMAAEEEEREREAEAKRKRREERKLRKQQEADEQQRLAEEAAQLAAEEEAANARREERRKKREEKRRRLQEEQEELERQQREAEAASHRRKKGQKKDWDDYVASHPLEFSNDVPVEIKQVKVERDTKPPPSATEQLMNRSYTPQCPNCHAKYAKPPKEWNCPMCLRKFRQQFKTWQPDIDTCGVCKAGVGRFTRHHCRNCGRIVCGKCSDLKAKIPSLGWENEAVKVCRDCMEQLTAASVAAAGATH